MENIEFWKTPEGEVMFKINNSTSQRLTRFRHGIINDILRIVENNYPECYARLMKMYGKDQDANYQMCCRFISCNLGEHDILTNDFESGIINFEHVKCPLRGGLCEHEGIICNPKGVVTLPPAEKEVVKLYVAGYSAKEIAELLNKSGETVKAQLRSAKIRLNLHTCREITKYMRTKNL